MTNVDFRNALGRLGLSQSALARVMRQLGDPRGQMTLLRSISNWCRGETAVPGEMWVVIRLLELTPSYLSVEAS
ncbi:hypothetical protein [Rhodopila sp.]|uniref:hypothetical protein n=1 Tax=Rhodopila sp. TaxID=2480087 RepID=UPI003D0DC878